MAHHGAIRKGVIVAAGQGKRMRPITYWRPKPLVPVGGRPILEHILCGFAEAGVAEVCVVVGHLGEAIEQWLGDGRALGLSVRYRRQQVADGTARAVDLAREFVAGEAFMLSWGDILVPREHYRRAVEHWAAGNCDAILSVNWVDDPWEGAAVYVKDGIVERIIEKPPRGTSRTNFNNAGIFILPPDVFDFIDRLEPSPRGEYELPAAIADMIAAGFAFRAVEVQGYWSDVARPATAIAMNGPVLQAEWPQGLRIEDGAEISPKARLLPPAFVGAGAVVEDGCEVGPNAVVMSGTRIGRGSKLRNSTLLPGSIVGPASELEWLYADQSARLPARTRLVATADAPVVLPPGQ